MPKHTPAERRKHKMPGRMPEMMGGGAFGFQRPGAPPKKAPKRKRAKR